MQPADEGPALGPRVAAALVFVTSGAVLVLEILSLRLVAPYIGLTLETNTAVIGMALAAIATGAWFGGRAADAVPPAWLLGPLVLGGGALVLAVLPVVRWAGHVIQGRDALAVLLIAAATVFAPAALLSAVPPVVVKIRLATLAQTGTVVGSLSSVGTLGAIAATFVTGFVLIAMVPTSMILWGLGAVLILTGVAITAVMGRSRAAAGPVAVALLCGATSVFAPQPCDLETVYHCARVTTDSARPSGRQLLLDTLRHSYVDLADPTHLEYSYTQGIASAVDVLWPPGAPIEVLNLGAGGLTLPRYIAHARPGSGNLVLEIDAGVLAIDRIDLGLGRIRGVRTRVVDARIGTADAPTASRDLVIGDAFGGVAVPWHLTTREMVGQIRRVLKDSGVYIVNVIDNPPLAFARAEVKTIAAEFRHVAVVAVPGTLAGRTGGNVVIVASDRPLPVDALGTRLTTRGATLDVLAERAAVARFAGDARILTDDFAPVDQLLTPTTR